MIKRYNFLLKPKYSIVQDLQITDETFYQQWGCEKIYFKDEKKYIKTFKIGFNLWINNGTFNSERFISSWCEDSPHFIITREQQKNGYLSIFDEIDVVIDNSYVVPYKCQKTTGCRFQCKNKWKINRHEKTCTNVTKIKYTQKCYGNQSNVRTDLIKIGVIDENDDTHRRFISFDIESVNDTNCDLVFGKTIITGVQKVISIGYSASFGDYRDVLFRDDMTNDSGIKLVRAFLGKMTEIQTRHYERIPSVIKDVMMEYKNLLQAKSLSVRERSTLSRRLSYLRQLCKLKILGFNSGSYDLPCILEMIIECVGPRNVKVIKKGNSVFDLNVNMLSFRDAMNYTGPLSLSKFAQMFKLSISKQLFPYEEFESITAIRNQKEWPSYPTFRSSLPCKNTDFIQEITIILTNKDKYGFVTMNALCAFFGLPCHYFSSEQLESSFFPSISTDQHYRIKQHFNISPLNYVDQKNSYDESITNGKYTSFIDYLYEYNLCDCDLLTQAMTKFIDGFESCFGVSLLDKLSLPGISEQIMWSLYDEGCPKMFSFSEKFGFLNQQIRSKLQGGPTICFHRHCEGEFQT